MPGWAQAALNWALGGISDLWHKVISLLSSLVNGIYQEIDSVWHDFVSYYNALVSFIDAIESWVVNQFNSIVAWTSHYISDIENWVVGLINSIAHDISSVISWVSNLISTLERWVESLWNDVYQWVIKNIWDPIVKSISDVVNWINKYGYTAWYLATHPDALAQLVGRYLLDSYLDLLRDYAGPIGNWLVHQMMRAVSPIGSVLEDILAAVIE